MKPQKLIQLKINLETERVWLDHKAHVAGQSTTANFLGGERKQ
jgi:hypothetical protein